MPKYPKEALEFSFVKETITELDQMLKALKAYFLSKPQAKIPGGSNSPSRRNAEHETSMT